MPAFDAWLKAAAWPDASDRLALQRLLDAPLGGRCAPVCCDANLQRMLHLQALHLCLTHFRCRDPGALHTLSLNSLQHWLAPPHRYIPMQVAMWFAACPGALPRAQGLVREVLNDTETPWQVAMELLCAFQRQVGGPGKPMLRKTRRRALERHPNPTLSRLARTHGVPLP